MRITGQKPTTGVQGKGVKKSGGSSGSSFRPEFGDEAASSSETTSSSGIQGMDALLALQEVGGDEQKRRKAMQHGNTLLDSLEDLRADLLAGRLSEDKLEVLASHVSQVVESGDDRVDGVLQEIELRVKVELAKLGRFTD